jgi:hypothetical protein
MDPSMSRLSRVLCLSLASLTTPALLAQSPIPLWVDSVRTERARDVLVRVVEYNIDRSGLRLESIQPIQHVLLDALEIEGFELDERSYAFERCDAVLVDQVQVLAESVSLRLECFLPRTSAVVAGCVVPIEAGRFGAMQCERLD